jgi:hypothetical protein
VLALGLRQRTTAGVFAGQLVERSVEFAGSERLAGLGFLPPFPPVGGRVRKDILLGGLGLALLRSFFSLWFEL